MKWDAYTFSWLKIPISLCSFSSTVIPVTDLSANWIEGKFYEAGEEGSEGWGVMWGCGGQVNTKLSEVN